MKNKLSGIQKITIAISVLSLLLSSYNFYLTRNDKKEVLSYSVRRDYMFLSFLDDYYDNWLNGESNELAVLGGQQIIISIYNNSESTISFKDIELYSINKEGKEKVSHLKPGVTLNKDVLEPGEYATHVIVEGLFNEINNKIIANELEEYFSNDIKNGDCKKVCNPVKSEGGYDIGYLSDSFNYKYSANQEIFKINKRKIKYITSKDTVLNVVEEYTGGDTLAFFEIDR